jgi:hypothetical protein
MAQVKNNRAAPQPSLALTFEAPEGSLPTLRWLGTSPWDGPGPAPELLERAKTFLTDFLKEGPRTCAAIWPAAAAGSALRSLPTHTGKETMHGSDETFDAQGQLVGG